MYCTRSLLALTVFLLPLGPLLAQDIDFLPETVIETANAQPFNPGGGQLTESANIPYTLSLLPTEANQTIRDVVRWDPAISSQVGNGVFDFFTLRGFDSLTGVNVAIDGVVEPETSFYHMHNVEQVQVAKGPFSTYFGRDALAGNVNLVRKQPHSEREITLGAEYGSFEHAQFDVDMNLPSQLRVNGLFRGSEGYRDDMDSTAINLTLAKAWDVGDATRITATTDFTRNEFTPDSGIPTLGDQLLPGLSNKANFQSDGEFSEQEIFRGTVNIETEVNDRWTAQNRTYFTLFDWESSGSIFGSFAAFGAGLESQPTSLARIRPDLDDEQRIFGNHLALRGDLDDHQLLIGAEVRELSDKFELPIEVIDDINIYTGQTSPGILPPIPGQSGDAELKEYSLYAIDQYRLSDTLSLLGGVRGQLFDFVDRDQETSRDDEEVSGSIGLLCQPSSEYSYYINAGTAYATPSTQIQGPRGEPEESSSIEGGIKYQSLDGGLSGSVAIFNIERENIGIPTTTGILAANGSQSSTGFEATLQTRVAEGVQLAAGYAYLDAELDDFAEFDQRGRMDYSGNTAAFAPENTVTLRAIFDVNEKIAINAGLVYQDEQFIAPDNQFEIDAQTYTELGATYRHNEAWTCSFSLRNLLDEELYGRGAGATSVRPEDGFGIFGRLERKF